MSQENNDPKRGLGRRIADSVRAASDGVRTATVSALRGVADRIEGPIESFEVANRKIPFQVDPARKTLWGTKDQIAEVYGRDRTVIGKHLKSLFESKELDEKAVSADFARTGPDGKTYQVTHYNLIAILRVGFKVHSPRAAEFRDWATQKLERYIVDGFVLNEQRLRNDPTAAQSLAERVREIRFSEKNLYQRVRDCVASIASDYDGSSDHIRQFFAKMQDKFHWAACENTAQDILLSRADGNKDHMGMTTHLNARLTVKDANIAKNYLSEEELKLQRLAGEQFFGYVEIMMIKGKTLTTVQLMAKIDEVFKFNELPVFPGYVGPSRKLQTETHVRTQLDLFRARTAQERYDDARRSPPSA